MAVKKGGHKENSPEKGKGKSGDRKSDGKKSKTDKKGSK